MEQKTFKAIPVEELKEILRVIEDAANKITIKVDKDAFKTLKERIMNQYLQDELIRELNYIGVDLKEQYIEAVAKLIKTAIDYLDYNYIDVGDLYPKEIGKLYEELGFASWKYDECIHFGFVETTDGTALIYTCSDEPPFKLEVAINGVTIE
jgi:hypothetical protein